MEDGHRRSMFAGGNMMQTMGQTSRQPLRFLGGTYSRSTIANLAKMHFIKNHFIRMADAPESCQKCKHGYDTERQVVIPF